MFRVGQIIYATQFHPELDVAGIVARVRVYQHAGYFPAAELDQLSPAQRRGGTEPGRMLAPSSAGTADVGGRCSTA